MRIPAPAALLLALLQGGAILLAPTPARAALADLDDAAMQNVSGAGIAIALDDFEFAMAPTSYFEQVGTAPTDIADTLPGDLCAGTGSVASNTNCWRRGDLRWYGINISGAGNTGYHWDDSTPCSSGSLSCPRGGVIDNFAPFDNPYIIRAWSPVGIASDGTCVNGVTGSCTTPGAPTSKAIYEFLAPTSQPNYTFSWWGEMEVGSTRNSQTQVLNSGTRDGLNKSQNIIRGNAAGSIFRMFNAGTAANPTFGLFYHSYLRGDYRFSVAQSVIKNTIGEAPVFADTGGMSFRNVEAFIPVGQLYYQALTIKALGTNGNFELALTPLPTGTAAGDIAVQNKHYALNVGDPLGYETARANNTVGYCSNANELPPCATSILTPGGTISADYSLTHGYARWGRMNWNGAQTGLVLIPDGPDAGTAPDLVADPYRNAADTSNDGILFQNCSGCDPFYAYADRPLVIDKRGPTGSTQRSQNYQCNTLNAGGCTVPAGASGSTNVVSAGAAIATRTYPRLSGSTVNLGDSRIEGLMIQTLRIQSCGGVPSC